MPESALHPPPSYWRLLAGGPKSLRLSHRGSGVVVAGGLALLCTAEAASIVGGAAGPATWWPSAAAATLTAWLVAAWAARWLGSRVGAVAGLAVLSSVWLLHLRRGAVVEVLSCAAVSAAMGAFALANVPGRRPLVDHRWTCWAFYAAAGVSFFLAGPLGLGVILTGCLLYLIVSADSRGMRFLLSPGGLAIFALALALGTTYSQGWAGLRTSSGVAGETPAVWTSLPKVIGHLAVAGLPWTPLAVLAFVAGVRQGHYATPIWRFLGCWALGPLVLAGVGGFRAPADVGLLLPPLAVMAAAGTWGLLIWCRLRWRCVRGRRVATARL